MSTEDRRTPGMARTPFDALVEIGGALGPSFEAQAVNVSEEGIHLRTAYLPELGQPLTCRFEAGAGKSVLAAGQVVWSTGEAKGGEFGVRFTDMDAESVEALKRITGVLEEAPATQAGSKVRLHIEGLASPMRAKIRESQPSAVTVGSELGFLQVGKQLELEDAQHGGKRPACIDRVEVAIDPDSRVPQLVVTLRYADVEADEAAAPSQEADLGRPQAGKRTESLASTADDLAAIEEASLRMKGALSRGMAQVVPSFHRFVKRAKTTALLLAARRAAQSEDGAPRRTTSPPPGGGLHATGRRVVRGESSPSIEAASAESQKAKVTRRKTIIATAIMAAAVVGAIGIKKWHREPLPEKAVVAAPEPVATTAKSAELSAATPPAPVAPAPPPDPPVVPASQANAVASDDTADDSSGHKKHGHVAPFGNGPVHHGNVLRLKMDGPIETLEGASQPTGFAVKIPGRKSLEAAAPLASRDSRIAAIKVSNEQSGAELSMSFKDGVPNYQVSARGDTLVISLSTSTSQAGSDKPDKLAKKEPKAAKRGKHAL